MKLFTEEQMVLALNLYNDTNCTYSEVIDSLTPIELPSDEEIDKYVDSTPYYGHCTFEFKEGIEDGAKWVIEQIKQQDK